MILDTFQHNGATVQIRLHDEGGRFVLRATDSTGEVINGYDYSVTKLDQIDAIVAATLDPLKELAKAARADVESGAGSTTSMPCALSKSERKRDNNETAK